MYRTAACLIPVCACVVLQGCATESLGAAPAGPVRDAATISASSRFWTKIPDAMTAVASINSVDGQKTKANTSKVLVSPGHHTLSVTCRWGFVNNTQNLEVDAKAGAHYELDTVFSGGSGSCGMALRELQ